MKKIDWGSFGSIRPINRHYGFSRGKPIDRYYIENFLKEEEDLITGNVLEFLNPDYTKKFGHHVRNSDVMATANDKKLKNMIVGDLGNIDSPLASERYDCIIATQVLQYMIKTRTAMNNLYEALKPGGVLLGSWAVATRTHEIERKRWPFMTSVSASWLRHQLARDNYKPIEVEEHGNVLVLTSFLWGLCVEDLTTKQLNHKDPDFPMILTFKAVKL